jgi:hypothetical protein
MNPIGSEPQSTKTAGAVAASRKIGIYPDQNVFSHIANDDSDWKNNEWASVFLEAQQAGTAEVWAGPTHVIETLQCSDEDFRKRIASIILELIEARRMWWGHEFEALQDFVGFVQIFATKGLRFREYLDRQMETMRQLWLGGLALVASTGTTKFLTAIERLQRIKAVSRLLIARLSANPDWVDRIVKTAKEWETTTDDVFAEFESMSLQDIEREIDAAAANAKKLGSKALQRLNQNRQEISSAYGALEIGTLLQSIFTLPMELILLFDLAEIRRGLLRVETEKKWVLLSGDVRTVPDVQLVQPPFTAAILHGAIRAASYAGLVTTSVGYQTVLLEIQKRLNAGQQPTAGLTFDADHSVAITRFEIFATTDGIFAGGLKTIASSLEKRTKGEWRPQVVTNPKQLREALNRAGKRKTSA